MKTSHPSSCARRRALRLFTLLAAGAGWPALSAATSGAATRLAQLQPEATSSEQPVLKVALVLPPRDGPYARAGAALRAGFRAALEREPGPALQMDWVEAGDSPESLRALWRDLADRGCVMAVGPLTRAGVTAVADAGRPPLPTLLLNQPEGHERREADLLTFALPIEHEARQAAELAWRELPDTAGTRPRALLLTQPSPLSRRAAQAFQDAWIAMGGEAEWLPDLDPRASPGEAAVLLAGRMAQVVFLAVGAEALRPVRQALAALQQTGGGALAAASGAMDLLPTPMLVGTTQLVSGMVGNGLRAPELDGIRLVEMPWIVQPAEAAAGLPRPTGAQSHVELQRLHALGIDACRITRRLVQHERGFDIDGATGRLVFDARQSLRIHRTGLPVAFRGGVPVALLR